MWSVVLRSGNLYSGLCFLVGQFTSLRPAVSCYESLYEVCASPDVHVYPTLEHYECCDPDELPFL